MENQSNLEKFNKFYESKSARIARKIILLFVVILIVFLLVNTYAQATIKSMNYKLRNTSGISSVHSIQLTKTELEANIVNKVYYNTGLMELEDVEEATSYAGFGEATAYVFKNKREATEFRKTIDTNEDIFCEQHNKVIIIGNEIGVTMFIQSFLVYTIISKVF